MKIITLSELQCLTFRTPGI